MADRAAIVLITFNSATYLRRCIEGIRGLTGVRVDVVHVDNASSDDSVRIVAELRDGVASFKQFKNEENVGFAAAANQGIRAVTADYILLLNPDVYLEPPFLSEVIGAMERDPDVGTAGGKLLQGRGERIEPTGLVDSVGIRMTRTGRHFDEGNGEPDKWLASDPVEVFGITGAAVVLRRTFVDDVAIAGECFDERFFAYREDADLAWRGQIFGWKSLFVPTAVGYHVRTVTPAARASLAPIINMHSVKNRFLLRLNNQGASLALRHLPFQAVRDALVIAGVLAQERSSLPALSWLWDNRREIVERRKQIQSRRRVSDAAMARWFR